MSFRAIGLAALLCLAAAGPARGEAAAGAGPAVEEDGMREIFFLSAADNTQQPALFYAPKEPGPRPLLVALHSWSTDYRHAGGNSYYQECRRRGWALIFPDFRGPNRTPAAGGSDLAVGDIVSAVEYARAHAEIDPKRIYLSGGSGGGHAALLLAGRAPDTWAGVSAWVPITDLAAWHRENTARGGGYARDMEKICGGAPGSGPEADEQYRRRSPLTWLANAAAVPVDINAGIRDGHQGSVPISHALRAFNLLAAEADRLAEAEIALMTEQAEVPENLRFEGTDEAYGRRAVLFRRSSNNARVTIFDGGHENIVGAAFAWLARQEKK